MKTILNNKVIILLIIVLVGLFFVTKNQQLQESSMKEAKINAQIKELEQQDAQEKEKKQLELRNKDTAESVVNVLCPTEGGDISGGSGTLISSDGIVLTNNHVIPKDTVDSTCLITIPDPDTGAPKEIYYAHPYPDESGFSDDYDINFLIIYDVFTDDEGVKQGEFPKTFKHVDTAKGCTLGDTKLGDPVRILGYPAVSGGYSLTITDGIVSSLPGDGLIITSAKIDHGNSGGLAVGKDGCMMGIPTLGLKGDFESLGVLISTDLANEFANKISDYLNKK